MPEYSNREQYEEEKEGMPIDATIIIKLISQENMTYRLVDDVGKNGSKEYQSVIHPLHK